MNYHFVRLVLIAILVSLSGCGRPRPATMYDLLSIHRRVFSQHEPSRYWSRIDSLKDLSLKWDIPSEDTVFIWEKSDGRMFIFDCNDTLTFKCCFNDSYEPGMEYVRPNLFMLHKMLLTQWNTDSIKQISSKICEFCDSTYLFEQPYHEAYLSRFVISEKNVAHDTISFSDIATDFYIKQLLAAKDTVSISKIKDSYVDSLITYYTTMYERIRARRQERKKRS